MAISFKISKHDHAGGGECRAYYSRAIHRRFQTSYQFGLKIG
jgi:hypothetical protein